MEHSIRPGRGADLEGILGIYNHYVTTSPATFEVDPVCREDRLAWLKEHADRGRHRLLVAEDSEGRIGGWATTSPFRPRAAYATTVESSVYLRPELVSQGLGSKLYGSLFRSIEDEDIDQIVAGISLPNAASIALHLRFGFRPVGTFLRVGRKFGRFWDVAWFQRPLRLPSVGTTR